MPGAATARAAAPIVSVIARLVLGLITCIRTEDITTPCGRRTAGKIGQADAIALEAQAGDNMIKMVHQRLAERLQGFIPQQTDQLLVIVATAALSPGAPQAAITKEERWLRRVTISVSTGLPEIACS